MKNINIKIIFGLLASVFILLASCEEEERPYKYTQPSGVTYALWQNEEVSYEFPKFNNDELPADGLASIDIKLYGPAPETNLSVSFEVLDSSTAIVGEHFDFSTDVITVEAGKLNATLNLEVYNGYPYDELTGESINGGMPLEEELFLYLKLNGGDIDPYGITGQVVSVSLYEFNYCPWDVYDLAGIYDVVETSYWGDQYPSTVEIIVPEGQSGPVYEVNYTTLWKTAPDILWGEVWTDGPVEIVEGEIDATDKAFPEVYIPNQYLGTTDNAWEYWVASWSDWSTVWFCDKEYELWYEIPYQGVMDNYVDVVGIIFDYSKKTAKVVNYQRFDYGAKLQRYLKE